MLLEFSFHLRPVNYELAHLASKWSRDNLTTYRIKKCIDNPEMSGTSSSWAVSYIG